MHLLKAQRVFYIVLLVFGILGLINLDLIPIPWLDEAACLEPAVMWKRTGHFISKAWPTPGTESIFLSYPPAIMMLHRFTLELFPPEVFWVRLPFLLLHLSAVLLLFLTLKHHLKLDVRWAALICLYFLFDKAVFEISRSVRSEVIEVFLLSLWFWIYTKQTRNNLACLFLGIIGGALLLTHLKEWPVVAVMSVWLLLSKPAPARLAAYATGMLLLPLLFLWFIDFRVDELYAQLFTHSMEHSAGGNIFKNIYNYFIGRFYPVYKEQPWLPLLHLFITIIALKQLRSSFKESIYAGVWIFAGLFWLFLLGPYYRYFIPMYFVGILILAQWINSRKIAFPDLYKWYYIPLMIGMLLPFGSRHALAIIQRPERDPAAAMQYLDREIPKQGKLLLYGNEIGMYYAAKYKHIDHAHETSPDHFQFNEYDTIYYLTDQPQPGLRLKSTYKPESLRLPAWAYKLGKGGTFKGMRIYIIESDTAWKRVAKPFYRWD